MFAPVSRKVVHSLVNSICSGPTTRQQAFCTLRSAAAAAETSHRDAGILVPQRRAGGCCRCSSVQRNSARSFHYKTTVFNIQGLHEKVVSSGSSNVIISRLMEVYDTQMFGTVHGGLQMILMEEAGVMLAKQHILDAANNEVDGEAPEVKILLVGVEKMRFLKPMFRGEVAEIEGKILYTSEHSFRIQLDIYGNNLIRAKRRLISTGIYWFVSVIDPDDGQSIVLRAPPLKTMSSTDQAEGQKASIALKQHKAEIQRKNTAAAIAKNIQITNISGGLGYFDANSTKWNSGYERGSVPHSTTVFKIPLHPIHCWPGESYVRGGISLAYMDEAACLTVINHISQYAFTVAAEKLVFYRKLHQGAMMVVTSTPIFTSDHTMEMHLAVDEDRLEPGEGIFRERCAEGIFTYASIDETGQPKVMTPLKVKTKEEIEAFEERKRIHEEMKKLNAEKKKNEKEE